MKSFTTPALAFVACAWMAPALQAAEEHMASMHDMHAMDSGHAMPPMANGHDMQTMPMAKTAQAEGVIRKVDKVAGKLTIKHGPLESLNMPPMTMVYRVQDTAMLERIKEGDKVRFLLENRNGTLVVTQVEPATP